MNTYRSSLDPRPLFEASLRGRAPGIEATSIGVHSTSYLYMDICCVLLLYYQEFIRMTLLRPCEGGYYRSCYLQPIYN